MRITWCSAAVTAAAGAILVGAPAHARAENSAGVDGSSGVATRGGAAVEDRTAPMYQPQTWSLVAPAGQISGNPFDIRATARFVGDDGSVTVVPMFYDGQSGGGRVYSFRFTGVRPDVSYQIETSSQVASLDGSAFSLLVTPGDGLGFVQSAGSGYAVESGESGRLRGFLLNILQTDPAGESSPFFHTHLSDFASNPIGRTRSYARYAADRGFTAIYVMLGNHLSDLGTFEGDQVQTPDPDLEAFEVLDQIVATAHEEGVHVHFWRWGDANRGWTAQGLPGGINGSADRRLTTYLAARLGAMPSWSIGYGFDLHEWVTPAQLEVWRSELAEGLAFPHLISARSHEFGSDASAIQGYAQGDDELGASASRVPEYDELRSLIESAPGRPHLLEERNVLERWGLDSDGTRLLMWRSAMAGGVGGWYGFFDHDPVFGNDTGYDNDEALATHGRFWRDRLEIGMVPEPGLTGPTGGDAFALLAPDLGSAVVFAESSDRVRLNVSELAVPRRAVAVDTRAAYEEIDLGLLEPVDQVWQAPRGSDWAIAIEPAGGCSGDVNGDGSITSADFFAWIVAFGDLDGSADINLDGEVTSSDLFAWVVQFEAGC
ncbi:MAG: GC-type dockerin domain-anchored protein [Planctomycetota bacterium]